MLNYIILWLFMMPFQLSAQWSKTIHQSVALPDTMTRFSIQSYTSFDTVFWIGSDIILETNVSMSGTKESVFNFFIVSDRYKWQMVNEGNWMLKTVNTSMNKLQDVTEQVKIKMYIPEYFNQSMDSFFVRTPLKD
ncbi:MAG: hypothetical protein NWS66_02570 [Saprospiraceae bacterium]|nr:hypothetical protein [Saprospiraceae bacterium]MDP4698803.1 hypothetical protein [Saprospiraceae bacterium]MDP4814642.1 hypothetical protein [Saprospiraceae bacterium]MDP4912874.1 hypothetical protein [Saprospiraceae bacterium]MDP5047314.1 hypothetical protein [Saprospiraceae bacterium]